MNRLKIKISDVYPNEGQVEGLPANPRLIKKEKVEQLKKSIQDLPEMTEARDLLVYPHNGKFIVIGGNMRLRAYRELGWKEVPCCILPDNMPVAKLREMVIQDNNPFGETDWNMIANEWDVEELKDWGMDLPADWDTSGIDDTKCEAEEDEFSDEDAEKAEPRVKLGEIWQLGEHRLMCGDSTDANSVALLMDGEKADMVFTDPPYNCNYGNIKHPKFKVREIKNDNMDSEHFRMFCEAFCKQIKEYCRGCVYMCAGQGEDGRTMFVAADRMLHNSTTIIWNKDQFTLGRGKYQNKYEPIWFGWVESGKDFSDDRTLTNVWDIPRPKKSELHPTMKPINLIETALKHNPKSKLVLDLFGGSGSTLIACEQLNRKCHMMELDPHYCDVIIARWEKLTGKEAVKVHG